MNRLNLETYLNDHLAGSTAGLELLDTLARLEGLEQASVRLRNAVAEDQEQLLALMRSLSIEVGEYSNATRSTGLRLTAATQAITSPRNSSRFF